MKEDENERDGAETKGKKGVDGSSHFYLAFSTNLSRIQFLTHKSEFRKFIHNWMHLNAPRRIMDVSLCALRLLTWNFPHLVIGVLGKRNGCHHTQRIPPVHFPVHGPPYASTFWGPLQDPPP